LSNTGSLQSKPRSFLQVLLKEHGMMSAFFVSKSKTRVDLISPFIVAVREICDSQGVQQ
jgi:hypothetical protein